MAAVNTLNTKTHSSKEKAEFSFENADVKSICYCKQWTKSKLSFSSKCVAAKLCKPCTSFTSRPQSSCVMMLYRTLTLNILVSVVNISNSKTLFCQDWTENGQILVWTSKCFSYRRRRMESKTLMSFKHSTLWTWFTSNLHGVCGMGRYRTSRVKS